MSDQPRDDEQLPPIPDGGLSESMPDWLRRPPAWRTLKDAEVEQPEPVRTGELPEADTSVIDPRTFLTDDDLPRWLRTMGRPARSTADSADDAESSNAEIDGGDPTPTPVTASRFVPRSPVVKRPEGGPQPSRQSTMPSRVAKRDTRPEYRAAWWQGPQLVVLLVVALIFALVVIAMLLI